MQLLQGSGIIKREFGEIKVRYFTSRSTKIDGIDQDHLFNICKIIDQAQATEPTIEQLDTVWQVRSAEAFDQGDADTVIATQRVTDADDPCFNRHRF